ncbi:ATP-binding protein [Novosphingobium sp. EMRT-2]|uniref:ATP-binding protein n=1 Tax=Novosphingobium sp. EMRT-2 TaxID=2571749 RepID=UPI0010BD221C|nr:ATP-binding protein [Novosphingobium sp. EMRT-2]QCI93444.1 ATP-binding protein [Novosphingobium sp. EMRT-2]
MHLDAQKPDALPFVDTSIARQLLARMTITHEERGISVISGPWGIGKTTAIDAFARDHEFECLVIKVEPGAHKRGATYGDVMKRVVEALRGLRDLPAGTQISNSTWTLRQMIYTHLTELFDYPRYYESGSAPAFTFIFDEAQYLSREAIEALRFWNDSDRGTTPFPVGLIFVGNNEFALAESLGGESVISGAVRSRLLFEVPLTYAHVSDADLATFAQSRGVIEKSAIEAFLTYFSKPRIARDLRQAERKLSSCRRRAGEGPISADIINSVLHPDRI